MPVTLIKNAAWVVAYDGEKHTYLNDADVAFDGNSIVHVGPGFAGTAETTIDGRGLMVMPGLVNVHSHPASGADDQGLERRAGFAEALPVLAL
jgi:5-methylthioadenosine/S-adenosylhomocysteine deaminase